MAFLKKSLSQARIPSKTKWPPSRKQLCRSRSDSLEAGCSKTTSGIASHVLMDRRFMLTEAVRSPSYDTGKSLPHSPKATGHDFYIEERLPSNKG